MLKRTLLTSLCLGLATVGFVGCGGEETAPPADTTTPADVAAPGPETSTPEAEAPAPADTSAPAPETPATP